MVYGIYVQWDVSHLKKEENSDPCYNVDEPGDLKLSEIIQIQKEKYYMILL